MRHFDVHGLTFAVTGWPEVAEAVALDFAHFARPDGTPRVTVALERRAPDYDALGEGLASFVTPRNVVYQQPGRTVVDYFGRALAVVTGDRVLVQGEDAPLVHEAAYLYLLSRTGAHLDARGLIRLHALGLAGADGGVAVVLPSGGGKSTLALRALDAPGVRLVSEDTPLLDRHGLLHPFPLRIGINATDAGRLPSEHVRRIERMELHPKLALDVAAFADRIVPGAVLLRHIVVGRRSLGREARLRRIRAAGAVGPLLREAVVGVGVYQGMEFVLQHGMRSVGGMAPAGLRRLRSAAAGLRSATVWELVLGRDLEGNWGALAPLLGEQGDGHGGDAREVVDDVQADAGERLDRPAAAGEQSVEAVVEREQGAEPGAGEPR